MYSDAALFEAVFKQAYHAIIVINEHGIIEKFNPSAERIFLFSVKEAVGQNINILMGSPYKEKHDQYIKEYVATHASHNMIGKGRELIAQRKDGSKVNIFISVSEAILNGKSHFIAIIRDIDEIYIARRELQIANAKLQQEATFDKLTGAYNRIHFEHHLPGMIERVDANKDYLTFLMLDLDGFKNINDQYGHHTGDLLLIEFVRRIQSVLRQEDHLVRLGGDEFLVVAIVKRPGDSHILAERIMLRARHPYVLDDKEMLCNPSIGIANYPDAGTTSGELLQHADFALYQAKVSQRKIQVYREDLALKFQNRILLENAVTQALKMDQFSLAFQPQVDSQSGQVIGLEALLRLKTPTIELMPGDFIPVIENMGLVGELNKYVLKKLLSCLSRYTLPASAERFKIACNVSPQIPNFSAHLQELLAESHLLAASPFYLEFEITESKLMESDLRKPQQWDTVVPLLKKYHVHLAIDDFGVGYSSIYRLLEYQVSTIKLDKTFIDRLVLADEQAAGVIIKALAFVSEQLGFALIAEGVEIKEQVTVLKKLGCHIIQGYYFYQPLPEQEAFALIGAQLKS